MEPGGFARGRPYPPVVKMKRRPKRNESKPAAPRATDWSAVAGWYDRLVGDGGSEFHREVVLPGTLRLLQLSAGESALDVACGQGVLCRVLHEGGVRATGVDAAADLIDAARRRGPAEIEYLLGDARELGFLPENHFDAAACVLAIQNIHPIRAAFEGAARALKPGGRLVVVMMHPAFRGPKATSWGWEGNDVQYRRVDKYLTPRKEPIVTHPGKETNTFTWTFHKPLSAYVKALRQAGLLVDAMEEWPSHKHSDSGPRAAAENVARREIPMFLAVRAVKVPDVAWASRP